MAILIENWSLFGVLLCWSLANTILYDESDPKICIADRSKSGNFIMLSCRNKGFRSVPIVQMNTNNNHGKSYTLDLSENEFHTLPTNSFNGKILVDDNNWNSAGFVGKILVSDENWYEYYEISMILSSCGILEIQKGAFNGLENLVSLDLSHNRLTQIPADALSSLTNLYHLIIDGNDIKRLPTNAFPPMKRLYQLSVSSYKEITFEKDAFRGLTNLVKLELRSNNLSKLSLDVFNGLQNIKTIYLGNNSGMEFEHCTNQMDPTIGATKIKNLLNKMIQAYTVSIGVNTENSVHLQCMCGFHGTDEGELFCQMKADQEGSSTISSSLSTSFRYWERMLNGNDWNETSILFYMESLACGGNTYVCNVQNRIERSPGTRNLYRGEFL